MMKQIKERNLNKNNSTPLYYAAEKDSIKIGELLILQRANINIIDILIKKYDLMIFIHNNSILVKIFI